MFPSTNDLLSAEEEAALEIHRAHRTLGPRSQDPNTPCDILCRIHYFTIKESKRMERHSPGWLQMLCFKTPVGPTQRT